MDLVQLGAFLTSWEAFIIYVALGIIVSYSLKNTPSTTELKGVQGEKYVKRVLKRGLNRFKYRQLHDITLLNRSGRTSQFDHIVVSQYGIFVIETKNYGGKIYGTDYNTRWKQVIGSQENSFYSPVKQNQGHIISLQGLLGQQAPLIPIVAFTERADLTTVNSATVVYVNSLPRKIKSYKQKILTKQEVDRVVKIIKEVNLKGSKVKKLHKENVEKVQTIDGRLREENSTRGEY